MSGLGIVGGNTSIASNLSKLGARPALSLDAISGGASGASSATDDASQSGDASASDLKSKLLAAITDALKNADSNSKPEDLLDIIKQTVEKALKENGVELPGAASSQAAGAPKGDPATAARLLELLSTNGQSSSPVDLQSLLGDSATSSKQGELLSLLQQAPAGFNLNLNA